MSVPLYPFYYQSKNGEYIVAIAYFTIVRQRCIVGDVFIPTMDMPEETKTFSSERAALNYVKEWWMTQKYK